MNTKLSIFSFFLTFLGFSAIEAQKTVTNPQDQPQELGSVAWYRNYDMALAQAQKTGKPVFILFQEVPGCATCRNYGDNVLSHPIIVDALQHEFIPLAIYNNHKGDDKAVLDKYNEPSWNNPVSRIVNAKGKDIVERLNGEYSTAALALYMVTGLQKKAPKYLNLFVDDLLAEHVGTEVAYFEMYCFWSGEAALGQLDGVTNTSPGFMNGAEVVKVNFDKSVVSKKALIKYAEKNDCSFVKDVGQFKIDKDPQFYLKKSDYKYLPLLPSQKTKINAAIAKRDNPDQFLSPTQLELKHKLKVDKNKELQAIYEMDFLKAFKFISSKSRSIN